MQCFRWVVLKPLAQMEFPLYSIRSTGNSRGRYLSSSLSLILYRVSSFRMEEASQFIPISLCNVIYIIISKVITNRLKPILKSIVSPFQNAFVPGQLLSDNCLIAHELVNIINQSTKGKYFLTALKIDMFKAYDKVDWDFLEWLLNQMRIPAMCRQWIM